LLPASVPMKAIDYPNGAAPARCLMVFLPGQGDTAERFEQRGFVSEVRAQDLSIDMVAADASLGYYAKGILSERLFADVVQPRSTRGYEQVWLVGISMDGLGTVLYSRQRPAGEIYGVLALSPYLGETDRRARRLLVSSDRKSAGRHPRVGCAMRRRKLVPRDHSHGVWCSVLDTVSGDGGVT